MAEFDHQPHNWLIHKLMWEHLKGIAGRYSGGVMLDIGCGARPYQELFTPLVNVYIGLDYDEKKDAKATKPDIFANANSLPVASGSIDTVLLTEVLEHLPVPQATMREVCRVLRPGGHLILTAPMIWHLHEQPRDYYRYTRYGLDFLLKTNGLNVVHMADLTGFVATFIQMTSYFCWFGGGIGRWIRWLTFPAVWVAQRIAYLINNFDGTRNFSCLTVAVGRKSGSDLDVADV